MAPVRLPGALKQLKLLPHQTIDDWSAWVREQAHGFRPWHNWEDSENFIEDEHILAWLGIVSSSGQSPSELEYEPGALLGNLLADVVDNGKTRIALIIPVRNLSKEEAETLSLPLANKRAKSLSGIAIPKRGGGRGKGGKGSRGGRGARKTYVKREVVKEEEGDVKIEEEEVEEDSDFPEAHDVFARKRKQNSLYPAREYNIN